MFLFNESNEIELKLQLFYKENDCRKAVIFDAVIKMEGDGLIMQMEYGNQMDACKHTNILMKEYKKGDFKIRDAVVDGKVVNIKIDDKIWFNHFYLKNGKSYCSMNMQHIQYEYIDEPIPTCYRLAPIASQLLIPYLTELSMQDSVVVGAHPTDYIGKCLCDDFYMFRDEHSVYIQTEENFTNIISVLSFFFCNPIEYDMVCRCEEDKRQVDIHIPNYKTIGAKRNEILGYLFCNGNSLSHLFDFLETTNTGMIQTLEGNSVTYIANLVRAEYLDAISKLLLYHSIIEKMAEVEKTDDTYNLIHKYFIKEHLLIEKINDGIESKGIQNEVKENISNFVQLRNFFVHYLGSKEAEDFLRNSDMLFYMKMAITILLLRKLGLEELKFDKHFHGISIFDETRKQSVYKYKEGKNDERRN